jgi:hypothetical protein
MRITTRDWIRLFCIALYDKITISGGVLLADIKMAWRDRDMNLFRDILFGPKKRR